MFSTKNNVDCNPNFMLSDKYFYLLFELKNLCFNQLIDWKTKEIMSWLQICIN